MMIRRHRQKPPVEEKRGRGRPKGSKNKRKKKTVKTEATNGSDKQ